MEIFTGLLIIAIGAFGQSGSYVPIKKVRSWAWECFWLTQGIFAWILFPLAGALLSVPAGSSLFSIISSAGSGVALKTMCFGALWGIGGLTFGLSMRYLGVALGQSLALGMCSAFGTLIPSLLPQLFPDAEKFSLLLAIGVSIALAGIAIIGYAGALKSQNMSEEEKKKAVADFALKKGLIIAVLAGVMSACFNLGLNAGLKTHLVEVVKVDGLYAGLPATMLVTFGGFIANAVYCIYQNIKNKTGRQYFSVSTKTLLNNLLFCAIAGGLWYSQFFGLGVGQSFLTGNPTMLAFSFSILMSLIVLFSNVWGIILKEWTGVGTKTIVTLVIGLAVLIFSIVFPQIV
ncbi:MAG: L-rhamnose/proton symporter RhaT [Prevotellaceae bacterium]|jgi:L-rhamnose-H+ transport protein|nr:L-rhamnose/proton symporter RhaT [Prevotellaceae bacterium]